MEKNALPLQQMNANIRNSHHKSNTLRPTMWLMRRAVWLVLLLTGGLGAVLFAQAGDDVRQTVYGPSAMIVNMERLFLLDNETMAVSESSYDRRGLNVDLPHSGLGNPYPTYLGIDSKGDKILLDVKGAGCVYRLFMSEMEKRTSCRLKIYLDGNDTPAIDEKVVDLCEGKIPGFPAPLVHIRNQTGSGGPATSQHNDVPIPFARAIRITTDDPGPNLYPNIQYHLFAPGTPIKSWTPGQDLSHALAMINRTGHDPKSQAGNITLSGSGTLSPGGRLALFEMQGPRQIQSIKIRIAGLSQWNGERLSHAGKSFTGASLFSVALFPRNDGVKLKRLHLVKPGASSAARVFVDGVEVGQWITRQENGLVRDNLFWRESEYYIPGQFTRGKNSISVKIENGKGGGSWNEFKYLVYCAHVDYALVNKDRDAIDKLTKGCGYRLSDILEIGSAESESRHRYVCTQEDWSGTIESRYPARKADAYLSILNNIRLQIHWDNEPNSGVDACLSGFFAQSRFGLDFPNHAVIARTIPVGLDEDDFLYCYFPMPFKQRGKVELVAAHIPMAAGIEYEIQYKDFKDSFENVGYFKTHEFYADKSETDTSNMTLLDVTGCGKFVGVTSNMEQSKLNRKGDAAFLEADERLYVDGSKTAAICGSGKEDFHGGSYYFWGGPYMLPFSGCVYNSKWGFNSERGTVKPYRCSAYRFMINDYVPFRSGLKFDMEHGSHLSYPGWPGEEKDAPNHDQEESHYLTFYYHNPEQAMALSDTLEVADAASQAAHHYDPRGKTPVTKTGNWDRNGYYDQTNHTASGMILSNGTANVFTLAIDSHNNGVMLRRLLWYAEANQEAFVSVDGQKVGVWYDAGKNWQKETDRKPMLWREAQFFVPAGFTRGKSKIQVGVAVASPTWTEYKYEVFSCNRQMTK
jgi:hypothetical protein